MENETNNNRKLNSSQRVMAYVIGANLLLLVIYTVWLKTSATNSDAIIYLAFLIAAQFLFNIVLGIILLIFKRTADYGRACLLSALTVLLIGFSTCYFVSAN